MDLIEVVPELPSDTVDENIVHENDDGLPEINDQIVAANGMQSNTETPDSTSPTSLKRPLMHRQNRQSRSYGECIRDGCDGLFKLEKDGLHMYYRCRVCRKRKKVNCRYKDKREARLGEGPRGDVEEERGQVKSAIRVEEEETGIESYEKHKNSVKSEPNSPEFGNSIPIFEQYKVSMLPTHETDESVELRDEIGTESERNPTCDWSEGALVWAKLKSYPWWPAIIKQNEGQIVRHNKKGNCQIPRPEYSVLFIDDGRYSWIPEIDLRHYKRVDDFETMKSEVVAKLSGVCKTKADAEMKKRGFCLVGRTGVLWRRSVQLAEKAVLLNCQQRLEQFQLVNKVLALVPVAQRSNKIPPIQLKKLSISTPKRSHKKCSRPPKRKREEHADQDSIIDEINIIKKAKIDTKTDIKGPPKTIKLEKECVLPERSVVACLTADPICHECCYPIEEEIGTNCANCKLSFHRDCSNQGTLCPQCLSGNPICNLCKSSEGSVDVKCSAWPCATYYHSQCAKEQRLADDSPKKFDPLTYKCSLHVCHSCLAQDKVEMAGKGRLLQCLKCPTSYHMKDECIPAGCNLLSTRYLVCPKHINRKEAACLITHINFDACFDCGKGGKLLCCEQCPMSYHVECLKMESAPDKAWMCVECRIGKFPMFNDIVWVKYGVYRWWPCEVLHPLSIPTNVENRSHSVGEFVVRFLGSHDYAHVSHGRVFAFSEKDSASQAAFSGGSKSTNKSFLKALEEAKLLVESRKTESAQNRADELIQEANIMPKYRVLKSNKHVSKLAQSRPPLSEYPVCGCKSTEKACCTDEVICANKAMQIECHPQLCHSNCANQKFRLGSVPLVMPFQTNGRGWGLRAMVFIAKGEFVCEYIGEIISQEEVRSRWLSQSKCPKPQFYFLTLDSRRVIDAGPAGNLSRFVNHSCEPNLISLTWQVFDDIRIGLFTSKDVYPGDELTFHYNLDSLDTEVKIPCHCNTKSCIGYIGKRMAKKIEFESDSRNKKCLKKKIKLKREKNCFRCKKEGYTIVCGRKGCPKVYHTDCLSLDCTPRGCWFCPWHYCDHCEKLSSVFCSKCDNSFCAAHAIGNVKHENEMILCNQPHL